MFPSEFEFAVLVVRPRNETVVSLYRQTYILDKHACSNPSSKKCSLASNGSRAYDAVFHKKIIGKDMLLSGSVSIFH